MPEPHESPVIVPETTEATQTQTPWNVVVLDDPVNLMGYVTMVLQQVFGYPKSKAETLMMQVHDLGRSVVWSGNKERAELYVQQLQSKQLRATMERAD